MNKRLIFPLPTKLDTVFNNIYFNKLYFSAPAPKQPKILSMNEMRSELSLKRLNNADNEDISMSESGEKMISQSAIKKQRPNNISINENNSESGDNPNNKGINSNNLVKVKHVGKNENSNDDDDDDEFDEMDEEDEEDEDLDDDIVLDEDDDDVEEEYDDEEGLDEDEDEEDEDDEGEDEDDDDGLGGEDEENDDNNEISGVKPLEKSLEDTSTSKVEFNKPEISQHIQVIE